VVRIAPSEGRLAVRDSKNPDGPRLTFGRTELAGLVDRVKAGDLDL
jgi:Domain of unknown function (DUF397)